MKTSHAFPLVLVGLMTFGALRAAESAAPGNAQPPTHATADAAASTSKPAEAAAKNEPASAAAAPAAEGVKGMARDFGKQSKDLLAKHQELTQRLKTAKTKEEKEQIMAELRQYQRQRLEQQRQLARNLRDQLQATRPGDGGMGAAISK